MNTELTWLADAEKTVRPLSEEQPIWIWQPVKPCGPFAPRPEYHPSCEFNLCLAGAAIQYAGRFQFHRRPGDVFLAGPGLPHCASITQPLTLIAAHFLPASLMTLDPRGDGARILHRFTAQSTPASICVRPPPGVFRRLTILFRSMLVEFTRPQFGSQLQLQTLLIQALVELLRWEQEHPTGVEQLAATEPWAPVERALQYLREHFTDRVYAQQLAEAAGVSESQLRRYFQKTLGTSWVHYLQRYRIHRAAALLFEPTRTITDTAFAVGFEDLGHFISVFRAHMGVSPSQYVKNLTQPPRRTPAI
ncbi:MAG: HTH-type transcriptional activator RhaR [Verrucomicrobiae bacterium]|nr:HTH-type transcriptional activator RhaR [Verrucomicrobiae bacterium]